MKPLNKGLTIALIQVALVCSLGAKLLMDRSSRPRVWVRAVPYDPDLPIRGRYVSLRLEVQLSEELKKTFDADVERYQGELGKGGITDNRIHFWPGMSHPAYISARAGKLFADKAPDQAYAEQQVATWNRWNSDERMYVLNHPVDYFIPEHIEDPSRRPAGEELWVEVTIPRKGPPRPIRLGVKKATGDGTITPLIIN